MNRKGIKIENLSYEINESSILNDISLEIPSGSMFGIIGANGAGKTTLIKNILGILKPNSGNINIEGKSIYDFSSRELYRKIAFVPQENKFDFPLTVIETVLLGRIPHLNRLHLEDENDYQIARNALESVGMKPFAERMANQLSVGEKQLVSIAKALAQQTNYIVLDEPTANLDISHSIDIMKKLKQLSASGKTIIIVLHDLNLTARYCEKILILKKGRVVDSGDAQEVLTKNQINEAFNVDVNIEKSNATGSSIIEPIDTIE